MKAFLLTAAESAAWKAPDNAKADAIAARIDLICDDETKTFVLVFEGDDIDGFEFCATLFASLAMDFERLRIAAKAKESPIIVPPSGILTV